jgi:hypothetical protein
MHTLVYTSAPDELRAVLRDVFGFRHVDAGEGWLIFAMPPSEMGVHPGDAPRAELSLLCDDITQTMADLRERGITFKGEPSDQGWGVVTVMELPGGVEIQLYEPRHQTAI